MDRDELQATVNDLSLLVMRLCRRMKSARAGSGSAAGDDQLAEQAMNYLRRKRLVSPLRDIIPEVK